VRYYQTQQQLDWNAILNYIVIFMAVFMIMRVTDKALEEPEKPKMLVHHSSRMGQELSTVSPAEHHSEITPEEWRFAEGLWETTRGKPPERGSSKGTLEVPIYGR